MAKIEQTLRFMVGSAVMAAMAGCGGGDAGGEADETDMVPMEAAAGPATVTIVSPADGAELDAGPVLVVMEVENLQVVEAGVMDAGTGHHHLIVNGDVDWELPIPNDPALRQATVYLQTAHPDTLGVSASEPLSVTIL